MQVPAAPPPTRPPARPPPTLEVQRRIWRQTVQAALGPLSHALLLFRVAGRWEGLCGWVLLGVLATEPVKPSRPPSRTNTLEPQ